MNTTKTELEKAIASFSMVKTAREGLERAEKILNSQIERLTPSEARVYAERTEADEMPETA